MIIVLIAVAATLFICAPIYKNWRYKKTAYYRITQTPYLFMDKGTLGEYLLYKSLRHFEIKGGKFLFNIYLPKRTGGTTEIDALLICSKGVFVFESKNYGGWIFGDDAHKNWTQTFPIGIGESHKERFYNPVMQNAAHVAHLRRFIGDISAVWSIIVFSNECTLKKVTIRNSRVRVVNRYKAADAVQQICDQIPNDILSVTEIDHIYDQLYPFTQVSNEIKARHVGRMPNISNR